MVKITSETLNDWKLAANIKKITKMATNNPTCKLLNVSSNTLLKPIGVMNKPRGNSPNEFSVAFTSLTAVPKSVWLMFAVTVMYGIAPKLSFSPLTKPGVILATSLKTGRSEFFNTGISPISVLLFIWFNGT
ncbi:hypothetical protein D3C84_756710 [compost metagenome]